ncbi:hypothetical protein HMPREF1348_01748 [Enterococcus faecium 505]|uniref:Uncharacterized protein n=1 Tax=Enterococcus faecium 505 TaxID=1134806 RepID=J6Y4X0_ENTFC|nr:hypothetical protein HMPREF1348_01748 [Enterococcus faecium 505]MBK4777179.1 hypothetical protein [Enterococcus faecium]
MSISSYFLKLTTSVTTSSLNGVQKLASAVISPPNKKYEELLLLAVLIT